MTAQKSGNMVSTSDLWNVLMQFYITEAWLLDDCVAVREALGLPESVNIPAVGRTVDPKATLDDLISGSSIDSDYVSALRDIARAVDVSRCKRAKNTGLAAFAEEVKSELGPLAARMYASS